MQRQQELQRDFHIRQMFLQDQIEQQTRLESMIHEQQLKAIGDHLQEFPDLQQHYSRLLLNEQMQRNEERSLAHDRLRMQAEEELRRRQLLAQQHHQPLEQMANSLPEVAVAAAASTAAESTSPTMAAQGINQSILRDIAADSLAGNAVRRSDFDRRQYAKPDPDALPPSKKRARPNTSGSGDLETTKRKPKKEKKEMKSKKTKKNARQTSGAAKRGVPVERVAKSMKPSAQALLDFASSSPQMTSGAETPSSAKFTAQVVNPTSQKRPPSPISSRDTLSDLFYAAESEDRSDNAANTLVDIKENVTWSESEEEDDTEEDERMLAVSKGETIQLPNFSSFLPQLPVEPELKMEPKAGKKHKSLFDEDSLDEKSTGKHENDKSTMRAKAANEKNPDGSINDSIYPLDTWWPSVASIKRERKLNGETPDDTEFDDNCVVLGDEQQFRANLSRVKERLSHDVQPGTLEKIPHCKIHRMLMKKRKNPTAPEFVYCCQVTELYPNDIMVCCSQCGTWRHAACGGHHKPYSVREAIKTPFVAICDRCHEEEKIIVEYPIARRRLDRQRCEQIRRGLSTSATMRQASFSKHGGTYKWPLGSVSATHIGGHTRSVHSRHDKAEKQWTEMATKLGRGYGYRPKERVKVRTKELERLLVSVEDAGELSNTYGRLFFVKLFRLTK